MFKFIRNFYTRFKLIDSRCEPDFILGFAAVFAILFVEWVVMLFIPIFIYDHLPGVFLLYGVIYALTIMIFIHLICDKCGLEQSEDVFLNTIAWPWLLIKIPKLMRETKERRKLQIMNA
jgi:hypothetical protein